MIIKTKLGLAMALALTSSSSWAALETTTCEVWRITDGSPLVTNDGRPVLTKQCSSKPVTSLATPDANQEPSTDIEAEAEAEPEAEIEAQSEAEPVLVPEAVPEPEPEPVLILVPEPVLILVPEPVLVPEAEPAIEPATATQTSAQATAPASVSESTAEVSEQAEAETEVVVQTIAPTAIKYVFNNYQSTVLFDTDKYNLSADTKGSLRQLAMASDKNEIIRVQLAGHADSRGTHAYNMHLSEHRMLAVAEFLATFNILPTSLFAKGETDPVLVNNIEDLSLSRRVNIILTTRQKVAAQ